MKNKDFSNMKSLTRMSEYKFLKKHTLKALLRFSLISQLNYLISLITSHSCVSHFSRKCSACLLRKEIKVK